MFYFATLITKKCPKCHNAAKVTKTEFRCGRLSNKFFKINEEAHLPEIYYIIIIIIKTSKKNIIFFFFEK